MLKKLIQKHWQILSYVFFGGLTTLVNWLVYFPLFNYFGVDSAVSNVIAWAASVAVAFLTNKPFVFKSHDWSVGTVFPELTKFVSARLLSGLIETLSLLVLVTWLGLDGNVMKVVISIIVVLLNYVASKLIVFK